MSTRRAFIKSSALAMFGVGAAPAWLSRAVYAADAMPKRNKVLVAIFQRGAADGLNIVVPHGDKEYYTLRPSIAVPKEMAIDLDGFFGLHPSLAPLKPLYDAKQLAIVEAVGSPDPTRSHFDAQDYMESGTPGLKATRDGWLNRALPGVSGTPSPVRAIAMGAQTPRTLRGKNPAVAVADLRSFTVNDTRSGATFESMYDSSLDTMLRGTGKDTFDAVKLLQSLQKQGYTPGNSAKYPNGKFGQSLQQIAQLIKSNVGLEVAFADIGGWDTHVNEFGATAKVGQLPNLLTEWAAALGAFYQDLGDRMQDVVLVTMSEFGRTARENGNRGTDHGHANVMFTMGGPVQGGKVYGDWPGLAPEKLYENRDLDITTDFRDVLGELVAGHLGNRDLKTVFPGYQPNLSKMQGLLKG